MAADPAGQVGKGWVGQEGWDHADGWLSQAGSPRAAMTGGDTWGMCTGGKPAEMRLVSWEHPELSDPGRGQLCTLR